MVAAEGATAVGRRWAAGPTWGGRGGRGANHGGDDSLRWCLRRPATGTEGGGCRQRPTQASPPVTVDRVPKGPLDQGRGAGPEASTVGLGPAAGHPGSFVEKRGLTCAASNEWPRPLGSRVARGYLRVLRGLRVLRDFQVHTTPVPLIVPVSEKVEWSNMETPWAMWITRYSPISTWQWLIQVGTSS